MIVDQEAVGNRLQALRRLYPSMPMSVLADRIAPEITGVIPVPYSNGTTPALEITRAMIDNPQA